MNGSYRVYCRLLFCFR